MKPIIFVIQMFFFLFSAIEASEYPQRKEFPLFKVEESGLIDDSVIDDIFINSKISQYSGAHKVNNLQNTKSRLVWNFLYFS